MMSLGLVQEVVVLVVGLESLHVVSLLGVLLLMLNTRMGGVVVLRWRGVIVHSLPFMVLVLLQLERVGYLIVVTMVVFVEVALVGEMFWIVLTPLWSKWLGTDFTLLVLTPVLSRLFAHVFVFEFQVGDLKNIWLIDSGCSRHVTGDKGWFSSLVPVVTKRYITFGDNGRGRVLSEVEIKVSDKITLRHVALVQSLGYNLLSVSQLLDESFEVLFRRGGSWILDSRGDLVCMVVPEGQVFRADFSQSSGVERFFLAGSSSELWKWHRKLGHLSFDLLSRLSKLNLVRGLPRLSLEKELVCAPCRHAKMVAPSHLPITDVMIERPCELLHMYLVGPARVRFVGGKWYVLVVVDNYSRYAWVFFLEETGETFGFVPDIVLRLRNERHGDVI
jgi:energy-converting hydrogenase Eha subunit C